MQTFITDFNLQQSAKNLDNKRLGKQRIEALQIVDCLLVKPSRWKNHPAVKMWKGYEPYLLFEYIPSIINEWVINRRYKNEKCAIWLQMLQKLVENEEIIEPNWVTKDFILRHKSNLIRKNPDYYIPIFGDNIPNDLPYIWPVK